MKNTLRDLLRILLLAVFLFSTIIMVRQLLDKQRGTDAYHSARDIVLSQEPVSQPTIPDAAEPTIPETQPAQPQWVPAPVEEDPVLTQLKDLDISALQQENPDILGWIHIPDSKIDYPLLQSEDNEYYLTHTWDRRENTVGSIFLECRNNPDFTDFNTIVYGHNMADGSMFADVSRFLGQWYFDRHPYVYIVLPEQILRYQVFAAYKAPVDSPVYGLSFRQESTRQKFLAHAAQNTQVSTGLTPAVTDRILTLSTCTGYGYENRWVLQAYLPMILEPAP